MTNAGKYSVLLCGAALVAAALLWQATWADSADSDQVPRRDRVVTTGGIFGTVASVEDEALMLKVAENTKIRVTKSSVAGKVGADGAPPTE